MKPPPDGTRHRAFAAALWSFSLEHSKHTLPALPPESLQAVLWYVYWAAQMALPYGDIIRYGTWLGLDQP
jgi:hypothetical protein